MVTLASILEMSNDFASFADVPHDGRSLGFGDACRKELKEVSYADGQ